MIAVVALGERSQHAELVTRWVWEEWRDPRFTFEQTHAQMLGEPDCPATLLAFDGGEPGEPPLGVLGFRRFDHARLGAGLLFVNSLYVVAPARGRGVGSELLACALERAAALAGTLHVYTGIAGWYEARGFTCKERDAVSGNAVLSCATGARAARGPARPAAR